MSTGRNQGSVVVTGKPTSRVRNDEPSRDDVALDDVAQERRDAEQLAVVVFGQGAAVVDDERVREPRHPVVLHRGEVAEGIRVRERPVLVEPLAVVSPLDVVEPSGVAAVVARVDPPLRVDLDAEGIAAPLGEDLVASRLGVVSPDELAHRVDRLVARPRPLHPPADRAPLRGVEPAVGAPAEAVDDRVRVLQPEPFEVNLGIAVGHVVVVLVGIEQQVGRVEDPDAPAPRAQAVAMFRPSTNVVCLSSMPSPSVSSWIVIRSRPADVVRRRLGDLIVDNPPDAVAAEHLQAGRLGILAILDDPHPAALVEVEEHGLRDLGLRQHQLDAEVVGDREPPERLGRAERARPRRPRVGGGAREGGEREGRREGMSVPSSGASLRHRRDHLGVEGSGRGR